MLTGASKLPEHPDSTAVSTPKHGNEVYDIDLILKSSSISEDEGPGYDLAN